MTNTIDRRVTADLEDEVVLFLIGMRINRPWKVWQWWPMFNAMRRMLNRLEQEPALGLLEAKSYAAPPDVMVVQYWESFDKLEAWARDPGLPHQPAWKAYKQAVGGTGDAGIWHETYVVKPGMTESVYENMPPHGLGAAVELTDATGPRLTAALRMRRREDDEPPVPPDKGQS